MVTYMAKDAYSCPLGNLMNALPVALGVSRKDCVLVSWWHLVLLRKLKSFVLTIVDT